MVTVLGGADRKGAAGGPRREDRLAAQQWARQLLWRRDWVILDTETTGIRHTDEVIQIGVLAPDGTPLLDTLLRPQQRIPADATAIHGITDAAVAAAPSFCEVREHLQALVAGRTIVCYNAAFDQRLILQTAFQNRVPTLVAGWECAMHQYSRFVGRWSVRHGNYTWQPLPRSGVYAHLQHQAIDDCLATFDVILTMAVP
jgi:DNA polymerase III subunit epsilon